MTAPAIDSIRPGSSGAGVADAAELAPGRLVLLPPIVDFGSTVDLFCRLRMLKAWPELRRLLAEDARLESVAARGIAGPDHTVEAMRFAATREGMTVEQCELEHLPAFDAVLVTARVHAPSCIPDRCHVTWLATGQERLIRRARLVAGREEAELILEREGCDLGV